MNKKIEDITEEECKQFIASVSDKSGVHPVKLLIHAIADLQQLQNHPDQFKIDMGEWIRVKQPIYSDEPKICLVCLAGSVFINTFKIDPFKNVNPKINIMTPYDFPDPIRDILRVVNLLRNGNLVDAYAELDRSTPPACVCILSVNPQHFNEFNSETFKADMSRVIEYILKYDPINE